MKTLESDEILRLNPQIDLAKVQEYLDYVSALQRAGLEVRPEYRLAPALGGPSRLATQALVDRPSRGPALR